MGIAPKGHSSMFASPDDNAKFRSLATEPVTGNSSRDRLAVTITALVKVSESCGNTAFSKLRQTSGQLGRTTGGRPRTIATSVAMPLLPDTDPAMTATVRTIGATGQRGMRVRA